MSIIDELRKKYNQAKNFVNTSPRLNFVDRANSFVSKKANQALMSPKLNFVDRASNFVKSDKKVAAPVWNIGNAPLNRKIVPGAYNLIARPFINGALDISLNSGLDIGRTLVDPSQQYNQLKSPITKLAWQGANKINPNAMAGTGVNSSRGEVLGNTGQIIKDIADVYIPGAGKKVLAPLIKRDLATYGYKQLLKQAIKTGVIQGGKEGAKVGGAYAFGEGLNENRNENLDNQLGNAMQAGIIGGAGGAIVGGAIGGLTPVVTRGGKVVYKTVKGGIKAYQAASPAERQAGFAKIPGKDALSNEARKIEEQLKLNIQKSKQQLALENTPQTNPSSQTPTITNQAGSFSIPENISSEDIKDIQNLSKFQTDSKAFEPIFNKWIGLIDSAKTKATQVADSVNNVSKDLHTKIIKGLEGGEVSPEVSKTVNLFRKKYDELYKVAKESGIDINYLKNYVTHIWKQSPEEVTQAYRVAKKKFNFANERTVPTYEEGIKMGLEPKFTNPAQIIGEYTRKLEQTKANIGMLNELKDSGIVVPASVGSRTPGFKPINATGLHKNFSRVDSDMGVIGDYYAPAEVADKINKIFSPETPDTIGKIARVGAKISGGAQDILLSGGIPKTPINAFTLAQTTKEVLAGRVKSPLMSMVKSLSGKSSDTFFKNNAKQIIKMQERNVPIQTSFDYNKMGDVIGAKNKLGNLWHKIVNEPTFKRFMPMLQVNLFNDVESSLLKAGKTKKEAADIAAKAVSNFYGLTNTGKTAQRSQLGKDVVSATLFAPRYRESMVNFWINNIKAMKNPLAPENKANTIFNIGALATIYGMNEANKALNGQNMWENPEGKKDKLLIPMGDKTLGIPFLSSIATIPRMAANATYDFATGDTKAGMKELKSNVSMAFRPIGDVLSNENYFGQEITNEYDSGSQKAKDIANYLLNPATGAYTHPYIREGTKFAQGKQGLTETLSKATELPIRWYNTKSIQNAPFWEKYGNQKKVQEITTASSQGKIKPEDAIKKIEKLSGGNKIPDGMMVDMANGGVAYLSGNKIKFADTREEAELEVAKEEFRKSDQKIGEFGDYVLLKDKAGKVTPITRPEFDSKIRSQRLEIFKEQKNYTEWTKIANEQMTYLKAEYETADPLTQLEIENKIIDLQDQIDKYASYGGNFTKPKKAKKAKKAKTFSMSTSDTFSQFKPKISLVKPTLKALKVTGGTSGTFRRPTAGGGGAIRLKRGA